MNNTYKACPEGIQPCGVKIETFTEEDTKYKKHCTQNNDASVPFKVGTLVPHTVPPITISWPIIFSWFSSMVWNLFPLKGDFSFWKSQKSQGAKTLCTRCDAWAGALVWWSCHHQLRIAAAFWIIGIFSVEECSRLMKNLMWINFCTHSVILNVTATWYTCSINGVYTPTD